VGRRRPRCRVGHDVAHRCASRRHSATVGWGLQDFGEGMAGPAGTGKFGVQGLEAARHDGRDWRAELVAAPDRCFRLSGAQFARARGCPSASGAVLR